MTQNKLIVVSRRDLTASYQSVQSGHAVIMFQYEHHEIAKKWYKESNYLVYLSVENESELKQLIHKLQQSNLKYSIFRESDIDDQITAICIEPSDETRQITSQLPLLLKEYKADNLLDKNNHKQLVLTN